MNIYTLGYEGIDQQQFLSWLLNHDIDVVADVRNLPFSRKKGFSKTSLSNFLEENKIEYKNFRNLGAPKELRSFLFETRDYKTFLKEYKKIIKKNKSDVEGLLTLVNKGKNVVLLCYEKDPKTCHRNVIANEVKKRDDNGLKIKHLGIL